jgi:hypothetical protein
MWLRRASAGNLPSCSIQFEAQAGARHLVGVGRADAAQGGAEFDLAARRSPSGVVEGEVGRGDDVGCQCEMRSRSGGDGNAGIAPGFCISASSVAGLTTTPLPTTPVV